MTFREEIERVPWAELTHAYGPAKDTPEHLLALFSRDSTAFNSALSNLWASICHQGSVYEASCAAVPFLIRILQEVSDERRPAILSLLAGLAHRDWYANRDLRVLHIERDYDSENKRMHEQQVWWSIGAFLEQGNKYHEARWMAEAHAQVAEGVPVYLDLLEGGDRVTVLSSLYLLSAFRELGDPVAEGIDALLMSQKPDPFVESAALLALGALLAGDSSSSMWERHVARLAPDAGIHPLVRFAAAVAMASYRPSAVPEAAVETLIDAVVEPERLDELHEILPWHQDSVHVDACLILSQLGSPRAVTGLVEALDRGARRWRVVDTVRVAEALLDAAFFGGWVQDRYWSYTSHDLGRFTLESVAQRMLKGDSSPYAERSYHNYGQSYQNGAEFSISSSGYVEEEAEQLRERFVQAGGIGLTSDERASLEAVLRCEPLWSVRHNLPEIYGLPQQKEELKALLSEA